MSMRSPVHCHGHGCWGTAQLFRPRDSSESLLILSEAPKYSGHPPIAHLLLPSAASSLGVCIDLLECGTNATYWVCSHTTEIPFLRVLEARYMAKMMVSARLFLLWLFSRTC